MSQGGAAAINNRSEPRMDADKHKWELLIEASYPSLSYPRSSASIRGTFLARSYSSIRRSVKDV
jgi:hypothetical protein